MCPVQEQPLGVEEAKTVGKTPLVARNRNPLMLDQRKGREGESG